MFTAITNGFRNVIAHYRAHNEAQIGNTIANNRAYNEAQFDITIASIRAHNEAQIGNTIANIRAYNEFVARCVQVIQKVYHVANAVFSSDVDLGSKLIVGLIRIYYVLKWNNRPTNPLPPNLPIPPQVVFRPVNVTPEKPT